MNKKITFILAFAFSAGATAHPGETQVAEDFSPGEVVSASEFNEIFDRIEHKLSAPTAADIVGDWSCDFYQYGIQNPERYGYTVISDPTRRGWAVKTAAIKINEPNGPDSIGNFGVIETETDYMGDFIPTFTQDRGTETVEYSIYDGYLLLLLNGFATDLRIKVLNTDHFTLTRPTADSHHRFISCDRMSL